MLTITEMRVMLGQLPASAALRTPHGQVEVGAPPDPPFDQVRPPARPGQRGQVGGRDPREQRWAQMCAWSTADCRDWM